MTKKEKNAGLIAGISLIIMAVAAGFAYGYVYTEFVDTSADILQSKLLAQKSLFKAGLAAWMLIFVTDLIVSATLYYFFRERNRFISGLTAMVRIIYTLVLGVAIFKLIGVLPLLNGENTGLAIQVHFASFEKIWSAGLIIFGFHLMGLGYLAMKSTTVPNFLAYLLYFAGVCYVLIHTAKQLELIGQQLIGSAENILALPMAAGEMALAFWLIYKGLRKSSFFVSMKADN